MRGREGARPSVWPTAPLLVDRTATPRHAMRGAPRSPAMPTSKPPCLTSERVMRICGAWHVPATSAVLPNPKTR